MTGVLFLLAATAAASAAPLRIAAEWPGAPCPSAATLTLVSGAAEGRRAGQSRCVAIVPVDVSDAGIDDASRRVAALPSVAAFVLEIRAPSEVSPEFSTRLSFAIKKLSSEARAVSPGAEVALDLTAGVSPESTLAVTSEDLGPYADALVIRPGRGAAEIAEVRDRWILAPRAPAGSAASEVLVLLQSHRPSIPSVTLIGLLAEPERPLSEADWSSLERLQAYWSSDVSPDPTETKATRADGTSIDVLRFFHAKTFTPILLLPEDAGTASISLSGGPYAKAAVENLASGTKRDFDLKGATSLSLDLSKGPLAVVLQPASRQGGETRAAVEVGATRELTAEEIVARERVWDAGQREKVSSYIALMDASLRFRVADVNETFDLTIEGDYFFRRGQDPDWAWRQFYLNGVRWKGRTLPKLPILEPQKVTTLPLDIRLTEDYAYELEGRSAVGDRPAYEITFRPRDTTTDRPIYRGTVWIDVETFALLRRNAIQLNLKGETLSNIQDEYYRPVPGRPDVCLPLLIRGQQVFSTAGRTTAIERNVTMTQVEINPANFQERLAAAYASKDQMVRDTDHGLRYLIPDPAKPSERIVEEKFSRRSLFGLAGGYYDNSLDYPIPLLGAEYFNFDLWGKGKQLSVFFAGVLLTANYSDPALFGSRFDLGADLFGQAIPFAEKIYVDGKIVPGETVKHLPEFFQVNVGHPLGPYLKASLGLFTNWNNYQRDSDTAPDFVVPVDHFTSGAELRLVANYLGFNAALTGSYSTRSDWQFWGLPGNPDYSPEDKNYWKWAVEISKDLYFSSFRKLHVSASYMDGSHLDRFSAYQFGTFSSHTLHGFSSSGPLADSAAVMNLSYGLNIENLIRFEGFYDQALLWNPQAGWNGEYFSGAGLLASLNGPLQNSIIRAEVGVPVVSHGIHGVVVFLTLLKLF